MGTTFSFPLSSPFTGGLFSFMPSIGRAQQLGATTNPLGGYDRLIDPVTHDYVRTDNGEWAETADARTIVMISLDLRLGMSPFDSRHGTAIAERRLAGIPVDPEFVQAEAVRVGQDLTDEGIVSGWTVAVRDREGNPFLDANGALIARLRWNDLTSGSPVSLAYAVR